MLRILHRHIFLSSGLSVRWAIANARLLPALIHRIRCRAIEVAGLCKPAPSPTTFDLLSKTTRHLIVGPRLPTYQPIVVNFVRGYQGMFRHAREQRSFRFPMAMLCLALVWTNAPDSSQPLLH